MKQLLTFLEAEQTEAGGFLSLSAADSDTFADAHVFPSVFSTTLVLSALSTAERTLSLDPELLEQLRALRARTTDFLLRQRSEHWTWNYWVRESEEYENIPYPDDLDDTFCALAALTESSQLDGVELVDGAAMAQIVKVLTSFEVAEGGPYRTWIVGEDADDVWKDVDPIVNANIAYFLALQELELAPLTEYLLDCIERDEFESPYYPSPAPRLFLGLRSLRQIVVVLEADIAQSEDAAVEEVRLEQVRSAVRKLEQQLQKQEMDEQLGKAIQAWLDPTSVDRDDLTAPWQPGVMYTGVNPAYDRRFYAGSAAVTAAFCLQAATTHVSEEKEGAASSSARALKELSQAVTAQLEQEIAELPQPLPRVATQQLEAMLESNSHHIILTPAYIAYSTGRADELDPAFLIQLGQASLLGWIAYTIYDDFLDQEGDPVSLAVATWAQRRFVQIFRNCLSDDQQQEAFSQLVDEIMNQLDAANGWEVVQTRVAVTDRDEERYLDLTSTEQLPDYQQLERLSHRSLGHALAPLAVLLELGCAVDSVEVRALREYFHHYLIARQLNDDAHDWRADLRQGHMTAVTGMILQDEDFAEADFSAMPLSELIPEMEKVFWERGIERVHAAVMEHATRAKQLVAEQAVFRDEEIFAEFLASAEAGMEQAVRERDKAQEFLKVYRER